MEELTPFARLAQLEAITVGHGGYAEVMHGITRNIEFAKYTRTPACSLLTGEAGVGKTNLCRAIVNHYRADTDRSAAYVSTKVGAYYLQIPSPVTIRSLASVMLDEMGDPKPQYGTALGMTRRLVKLSSKTSIRAKFLDEFQHLWSATSRGPGGDTARDNVRNWIKTLIEHVKVPIILVGMPSCEELIDADKQLSRRFPYRFRLFDIPLERDKEPEFQTYLALYASEAARLLRVKLPGFENRDDALRVYATTRGNPSCVHELFKCAVLEAMHADLPQEGLTLRYDIQPQRTLKDVELAHFRKAADLPYFVGSRFTQKNPFELEINALSQEITANEGRR